MVNIDTFWDKKAFNLQKIALSKIVKLILLSILSFLDPYYYAK